ncbi:acyltransferase family protein [Glutamicibacter arilaitensis]|uniref:acyltransferase family protein n=4 Tax=Glutamicibacter arilaitensis TaxID=256701 RepID=UPI003FD69F06
MQEVVNKTSPVSKFRLDIQGLRAIAVGLVVIYHLFPTRVTGGFIGVDVFFVISGFLITSHLIKSPPRKPKEFGKFWIRRINRLLPAAFTVLITTVVAIRVLAPEAFWRDNVLQAIAAAFYGENWMLIATSVDYLAEDNAPTAVQHFWSLSVEEQFYFCWPLIIAGLWWFAVRNRWSAKSTVLAGISILATISLAYSVYATSVEPGAAYFSTFTRAWELALGGIVALLPRPSQKFSESLGASLLGWAGIAAMLVAGLTYTGETPFPSFYAGLPVVGTALVIWVAATSKISPTPILSTKPFQFLGDHSYSIYLWHWPLIVLVPFVSGTLGMLDICLIAIATVLLSMATKKFIEDDFRKVLSKSAVVTPMRFLAAGTAVVAILGSSIAWDVHAREERSLAVLTAAVADAGPCFGAAALKSHNDACAYDPTETLALTPALAKDDKSDAYKDGCWSGEPFENKPTCTYGSGKTKVALAGNSHAGHWLPALQQIAEAKDWTITTYLVSRCNPTDVKLQFDAQIKSDGCYEYGRWLQEQTAKQDFDLIITSERQSVPVVGSTFETTAKPAEAGYASYLEKWAAQGTPIVIIRDTPYPGNTVSNVPDCVALAKDANAECSGTLAEWEWMDPLADAAYALDNPQVRVVDPTKYFCPDGKCPAVIGETVVYFDASHISATYSKSLAGLLARDITEATSSMNAVSNRRSS